MSSSKRDLRLELFKRGNGLSFGILTVSVVGSLLNCIGLTLLIPVMFKVFDLKGLESTTGFVTKLQDRIALYLPGNPSFWLLTIVIGLIVAKNVLVTIRLNISARLVRRHLLYFRNQLLDHFLNKEIYFFVSQGSGPILNQLSTNVDKASRVIVDFVEFAGFAFQLVTFGAVLCYLSWPLAIICVTFAVPLILLIKYMARRAKVLSTEQARAQGELTQTLTDVIHGIRFIKLAGRQKDEVTWVEAKSQQVLSRMQKLIVLININQPIGEVGATILLLCLLGFAMFVKANAWMGISIPADKFFTFLVILARTLPLSSVLAQRRIEIASNAGALSEIEKALADDTLIQVNTGTRMFDKLQTEFKFENVNFVYPGTSRTVLSAVNFSVRAGEHIAIVGPSGSGKSTLIDLFLRFYEPSGGRIKLDGIDYLDYEVTNFRSRIGLVPQEPILFFSTIRGNLTYCKPQANEDEIWRALEQADLAEFVAKLPEGLDTAIGEKGVRLSGGQKQRLSIARALLANPGILIFDEATSSLDSISEAKIVEAIRRVSMGRTTITIAHRLATILHCDRVLFFEQGTLIEQGTVSELMEHDSRFKKYAQAQNLKLAA